MFDSLCNTYLILYILRGCCRLGMRRKISYLNEGHFEIGHRITLNFHCITCYTIIFSSASNSFLSIAVPLRDFYWCSSKRLWLESQERVISTYMQQLRFSYNWWKLEVNYDFMFWLKHIQSFTIALKFPYSIDEQILNNLNLGCSNNFFTKCWTNRLNASHVFQ